MKNFKFFVGICNPTLTAVWNDPNWNDFIINAEEELTRFMSEEIARTIDEDIIRKLYSEINEGLILNEEIAEIIGEKIFQEECLIFKYEDTEKKEISDATRDAFAELTNLFTSYGLESLAGEISGYMTEGLTASEALIKLKTNPNGAYAKRFAGNFTRVKNGLNAISEAAYIGLENSYAETLKAYGLGNMINVNRDENYKTFANYIANDMSAVEFKDRISTVVTRVQNSDPGIKATLKSFYPAITDNDLIGYFLNPTENLLKLQEKVTASEIGAAAIGAGAGITTNVATATDLARFGIDQKAAREGYSTIAGILPTSTKLSDIYNQSGIRYAQAEGEAEVFKGSQDAALKRTRLASMERGSFSGSAGRLQTQSKNAGLI
jgi:hypothetical protein